MVGVKVIVGVAVGVFVLVGVYVKVAVGVSVANMASKGEPPLPPKNETRITMIPMTTNAMAP
jgi:hypothetical protein